jgi:hypothetical protein
MYAACVKRTGRKRILDSGEGDVLGRVRASGHYVGYQRPAYCDENGCQVQFASLNVQSGRTLESDGYFDIDAARSYLVLDFRGRIAYLTPFGELHKIDSQGDDEVDAGPGVERRSIRMSNGVLRWQVTGAARQRKLDVRSLCGERNSTAYANSPQVRFYQGQAGETACWLASGRKTLVGGSRLARIAGRYLAVDTGAFSRSGSSAELRVFDVAAGTQVHEWLCCKPSSDASVIALVLSPTGAVGWIGAASSYGSGPSFTRVMKSDANGEQVVLDEGSGVKYDSLRLEGGTLFWRNGDTQRSATLG